MPFIATESRPAGTPIRCIRCGETFGCGAAVEHCWCAGLAPIDPARLADLPDAVRAALNLPTGSDRSFREPPSCFCPACLPVLAAALAADGAGPPGGPPNP